MEETRKSIQAFIAEQSKGLDTGKSNYFGIVFGEVIKYYDYLIVLLPKYQEISELHVQSIKDRIKREKNIPQGSRTMTNGDIAWRNKSYVRQIRLHLELESLFIYASILLDRIASATQYYFGKSSRQWRSFEAMKNYLDGYCENKNLSKPSKGLMKTMSWLYGNVCEFRHTIVVHKHEDSYRVRLVFGTGWDNDSNEAYFNLGLMYPKGNEKTVISKKPSEILNKLNGFIYLWIEYLKLNESGRKADSSA